MRQQINLYQPIFSEQRQKFSAATFAVAMLLLCAALAAYSVKTDLQVDRLEIQVDALRTQQAEQEVQLESGEPPSAEAVEARVARLEKLIAERTKALELLKSGAAGTTLGFAPRLEALARRHVDGLWIELMQLSGTSAAMALEGSTLDPDIVPIYLRSLAQDAVLAGTRFDDFVIERPAPEAAETKADGESKTKAVDPKVLRFRAGRHELNARRAPEPAT